MLAALLCLIVGVSDGDTLTARCPAANPAHPYQQVCVRLAEIDAPESRQPSASAASATCPIYASRRMRRSADSHGSLWPHGGQGRMPRQGRQSGTSQGRLGLGLHQVPDRCGISRCRAGSTRGACRAVEHAGNRSGPYGSMGVSAKQPPQVGRCHGLHHRAQGRSVSIAARWIKALWLLTGASAICDWQVTEGGGETRRKVFLPHPPMGR